MDPDAKDVIIAQRKSVDEVVDRIDRVHGPYWRARLDLIKLLITILSALLAGTVTFSSSIVDNPETAKFLCLLYVAWSLLFLSLVSGVLAIWCSSKLHSFYPAYFNQSATLEAKIKALNNDDENFMDNVVGAFKEAIDNAIRPLGPADSRAEKATLCCLASFVLGLGVFLFFGALQVS